MTTHKTEKSVARRHAPRSKQQTGRLELRITVAQQQLLRRAAEVTNKSLNDFVLESANTAAEQILADKGYFLLNEVHWEKFEADLERPAQVKPTLVRLFASRAPWDE